MNDPKEYTLFGETLRLARVKLGLPSVRSMAEAIGVKYDQVFSWEAGTKFPLEEVLPKIAEVYKLDLVEITAVYKSSKGVRERYKNVRKNPLSRKSRAIDVVEVSGSVVAEISSVTKGYLPLKNAYGAYKGGNRYKKW
ncbi:MAG: hypothetical protein CEO12_661 [Parcubacteria group bacterium Gr01-1014_46]|nr:MAG: hypothetical protein CEO12_661 [Parcubacteria group bacterium Gr01-1014_46]